MGAIDFIMIGLALAACAGGWGLLHYLRKETAKTGALTVVNQQQEKVIQDVVKANEIKNRVGALSDADFERLRNDLNDRD